MSRKPVDVVGAEGVSAGGGGPCWSLETSLEMSVERALRPLRAGVEDAAGAASSARWRVVEWI